MLCLVHNTFLRPLYRSACVRQHVQLTTVRFFSAQCFTAHNQRIQISDKTLEFSSTLDSVIYAVSVVHKKQLNKQSWFWRILEFLEMRFMCSAYHWTNNKLATVSKVIVPCQTQKITLLLLLSSNHHHRHYVSCYEHEMYHLCQYEYDTSSANCKHNNINIDALLPDHYKCRIHTGYAKQGLFLRVDNFVTVSCEVCDMSKVSKCCLETRIKRKC